MKLPHPHTARGCTGNVPWVADGFSDRAYFKVITYAHHKPHLGSPNLTLVNFGEVFNFSEPLYKWETFRGNRKTHQRGPERPWVQEPHKAVKTVMVAAGNMAGWPHLFEEPAGLGDRGTGVPLHGV